MKEFCERLKEIRLEKNLSQKEVAKALNISTIGYLYYEKNQREPSFDMLIKIVKFFDVSLDYLFGLID